MKIARSVAIFMILATLIPTAWAESLFRHGIPASGEAVGNAPFPHFTELVRGLSRSVVNISVEADPEDPDGDGQSPRPLPMIPRDSERQLYSLGSGFIVSSDGYVLTNNHVIDRAKRVVVRLLDDKTDYEAKVIGRDAKTDLALIKIESSSALEPVYVGDSDQLEVGEWVIAIGNQFQLGQTVTAGIVSAKARKVPSREAGPYDSFIQTDASINPGSSGGPLFNTRGQVIGINTAIFSPGRSQPGAPGFNIGIGFAIPINLAATIVPQLQEKGKVTRGMLGVIIQPVDKDVAEAMGLAKQEGALVADVLSESPAGRAGFRRKDVILTFNGKAIRDHDDLPLMVANTAIGTVVKVEILRAGRSETLNPRIEELREQSAVPEKPKPIVNAIGLATSEVSAELAKALGMTAASGIVVEAVEPGSAAFRAGVVRGDVVEELNNQPITNSESLETAIASLKKGKSALLLIRRKEGTRFLSIKIE